MELSIELRNKLLEFILWQMQLCSQEKNIGRKGSKVGSMGMGKNFILVWSVSP